MLMKSMGAMAFCSPIMIKSIPPMERSYENPLPYCVKYGLRHLPV